MQITDYFAQIQFNLATIAEISSRDITFDQRSSFIGHIWGDIYFADGSRLHFPEYVDVEQVIDRVKYSYHFMQKDRLLFRYDNASDPRARVLKTYPHHIHTTDGQLIDSAAPTLAEVIAEIQELLINTQKGEN